LVCPTLVAPALILLDVIISTPLRLLQMIREGLIRLDQVQWLVLDEADRLLDDGFDEQVD
jgi:superfamily II DNA/RNA helicase